MKAFVIIGRVDVETLERETREADAAARAARGRLVAAVRRAYASGMSQREITDHEGSDIDLLVSADVPLGLFALAQVEQAASALLGVPVDLVLDDAIRPDLRDRILNEAVPL